MKSKFLLVGVVAMLGAFAPLYIFEKQVRGEFVLEKEAGANEKNELRNAEEAAKWRYERLADENGNYDASYYFKAVAQANQLKQRNNRAGGFNLKWDELGPDNIGGRTRAILIDKRDPSRQTLYAGAVSGGLWKSTDGGNNWVRLTTWKEWLSISCIAQGPDNKIYIGTGEGIGNLASGDKFGSNFTGNGIYLLINDAPVLLTPNTFNNNTLVINDRWSFVNRIAVNPSDASQIIAATRKGLFKSDDAGFTWNEITCTGLAGGQHSPDVKWGSSGINVYASVAGGSKLIVSQNAGFTFTMLTITNSTGFPFSGVGRIEIAVAPSNDSIVYTLIASTAGATVGAYRSENAGTNWTACALKGPLFDIFNYAHPPRDPVNQGWYDNTIAVSPADPNKIYMGGIEFYTWSNTGGVKFCDDVWGGPEDPYHIHADKHTIVIDDLNPNIMYVGSDGGVTKSTNALSAFPYPSFSTKNKGYAVTQNYSIGASRTGEVIGGSQDNGTNYINFNGNTTREATEVLGGDGTYNDISHLDPRVMFAGIYNGANYRSANGGSSFDGFYDIKVDVQGTGDPSGCGGTVNAQFISPSWLWETKHAENGFKTINYVATQNYNAGDVITVESKTARYPFSYTLPNAANAGDTLVIDDPVRSRFFIHSSCGVWVTSDALELGIIPRWYKLTNAITGYAEAVCTSPNGDTVYVGTTSGRVYKFPGFNARADTTRNATLMLYPNTLTFSYTQVTNRMIQGISIDPNDPTHLAVAVAGYSTNNEAHVYESNNGGTTWHALDGGSSSTLPNMPVYDVVVHDASTIVIGSELGMWSWNGTEWNEENDLYTGQNNNGMARVPAYRVIEKQLYDDNCRVLYVGTHGRGMWRSTTLTTGGCNVNVGIEEVKNTASIDDLNIFPNPVNSTSKISITLSKRADVTFRVFDMAGKLYREFSYKDAITGQNLFELDASNLVSGTYLLAATVGGVKTKSRLFIVSK